MTCERATFAGTGWVKKTGFAGTADSGYNGMVEDTHDWTIDTFYRPNACLPTAWSHGCAACDRHCNSGTTTP